MTNIGGLFVQKPLNFEGGLNCNGIDSCMGPLIDRLLANAGGIGHWTIY